jgi:LPXTG-motif cell wall-anchored protein
VPVNLDNSQSARTTTFFVSAWSVREGFYERRFTVTAGDRRVVSVPVPNNRVVEIDVADQYGSDLGSILPYNRMNVHCERAAAGHAARPTTDVQGAKLPQTGGFNFALPLLGVALLTGGAGMLVLSGRRRQY